MYHYNSKCFRNNQANLVREVISRDLDVSFAFSVKQCVRWPGIFLLVLISVVGITGEIPCAVRTVVRGCCRQPVAGLFAGGLGVCQLWLSSADRTESGSARQGQVKAFRQVGFLVQFCLGKFITQGLLLVSSGLLRSWEMPHLLHDVASIQL